MKYNQKDYERFMKEFNYELILAEKVTFLYNGSDLNGTIFIDEYAVTFIKDKENYIYRIPLEDISKYYKEVKFLKYNISMFYGRDYTCNFNFLDKSSLENFEFMLKVLLINKKRIKDRFTKEMDKLREKELSKMHEEKLTLEVHINERRCELYELNEKYKNEKENAIQTINKVVNIQNKKLREVEHKLKSSKKLLEKLQKQIQNLEDYKGRIELNIDFNESYVNNFEEDLTSQELKTKLELLTLEEKKMIKDSRAINYFGADRKTSEINSQVKQILRSFNTECDYLFNKVVAKNYETQHKKIVKSYEILNKIYRIDRVEINKEYLELKLKKLNLINQYQMRLQQEKEIQKEIREQIKEEEKVRREIENEKKKIEKEETQFNNEVKSLFKRLEKSSSEIEKELYADKIKELENKIKELEVVKKNVLDREQNTRAGYVYVISNVGSFGEDIYKIGVTRRLEPMDRISELSSASVPFEFDVHAMIFSDDAPKLEKTLHNHFREKEVNKVNHRKEFFKVSIDEIEEIVTQHHNKTVEFIKIPTANQYWQSVKLKSNVITNEQSNNLPS
ncbi:DUF4041 domain-containing protein [Staphylococcus hyicus]|uniref:DUF4041 domain-containing protein n=1 Tax=Staphylococcus hyicus TaxID=1284 RepID=UPI00208ED9AD|nr:DUF4041 domain-containing protein [Staphylococcus hyicus]MCO4331405.1 DUF4041 domain-containing protein [Staphylococcus hyicus]MCO4335063.1 DUF4041 domain-containing protein [Staphylococcus hyicus]